MKKIKNLLEKHRLVIITTIMVVISITSLVMLNNSLKRTHTPTHKYEFNESFDMRKIPSGTVIWVHGVPNYEEEGFIWIDEHNRYKYFDVGIWNQYDGFVYKIRIPFYARGMFLLGIIINPKKDYNKRNPNNENYVYPKENEMYKLL